MALRPLIGFRADQNFSGIGKGTQSGAQIDGFPRHSVGSLFRVHISRNCQSRVDAAVHGEGAAYFHFIRGA